MKKALPKKAQPEKGIELKKLIHDHSWNHFKLNAKQRVDLFKSYLLFLSIFFAGIYHVNDLPVLGPMIPIVFFIITLIFQSLDQRNRQIVEYARRSLIRFEKKEFQDYETSNEEKENIFMIFTKDKIAKDETMVKRFTHSNCYNAVWLVGYLASIVIFVYNIFSPFIHFCIYK